METEASLQSCDPYLQDFFLYCYQLSYAKAQSKEGGTEREDVIENNDQNTYIKLEREKSLTPQILIWMGDGDMKKWNNKVRRYSKAGQDSAGVDCELIDLDVLLALYMDEFVEKKRRN